MCGMPQVNVHDWPVVRTMRNRASPESDQVTSFFSSAAAAGAKRADMAADSNASAHAPIRRFVILETPGAKWM